MTPPRRSPYWEWELALTRHYLGTDGPEGSSPLEFIDAQPRRLAQAIGLPPDEEDSARRQFVSIFQRQGVVGAFAHGDGTPTPAGLPVMGHLNYLVLSCYVASVSPNVAESGQFPHRLREVLGWDRGISSMEGLAILWEKAAEWCERASAAGLDVRRVVLPDPGRMTRIGHSIRIAFPSRHDLARMERLFGHLARRSGLTARAAADAVRVEVGRDAWSQGFVRAFQDFDRRQGRGERLLADHPFWLGLMGLRLPPSRQERPLLFTLDVSTDFDGLDNYLVSTDREGVLLELGIERDPARSGEPLAVDASLRQVLDLFEQRPAELPGDLRQCHAEGYIPFVEVAWGVWRAVRQSGDAAVRPLVRDDVRSIGPDTTGQRVSWRLLPEMPPAEAAALALKARPRGNLGLTDVTRVRVSGGIPLNGSYLGRPAFLPTIQVVEGCKVSVIKISSASKSPTARVVGATVELASDCSLEGVWRFPVAEGGAVRSSPTVVFQRNAPERNVRTADEIVPNWRPAEPEPEDREEIRVSPAASCEPEGCADRSMLDLLEALYAAGGSGWDEQRLHRLLARALPEERAGWDFLRLLVDSGWIEARVCPTWRARKWFLTAPRIVAFDDGKTVALEGAACENTRNRFVETVRSMAGNAVIRTAERGWCVPQTVAEVSDQQDFADKLGLPLIVAAVSIPILGRQVTFPKSLYSDEFRIVASKWSWKKSRFVTYGGDDFAGISISRLTTRRPNAPDIYRVEIDGKGTVLLDGRAAAVTFAHLLAGRALYRYNPSLSAFDRLANDGGLPHSIARYLRLRCLRGPAILFGDDGRWTYRMPCGEVEAGWLQAILGAAFEGCPAREDQAALKASVMTRARGARAGVIAMGIWKGGR